MSITIEAYIGSNNQTKRLELEKIKRVLSKRHQGFTIKGTCVGYWRGEEERAAVVMISDEQEAIAGTIEELKRELKQEAIATMQVPNLVFA